MQNGTSYTFTVAARNGAGVGEASEPSPPRAPTSKDTDTDGDGLSDILEEQIGSNLELQDSDYDGLGDAHEAFHLIGHTSPTSADTDGDGVDDGATDSDGDGLDNAGEATAGTEPSDDDTDADGLLDGEESGHQTSALLEDTDGDGIKDGREVRLGLNPAAADSDDDGVLDGDAALVVTLESDADVSVAATGIAEDLENLTVVTDPVSPFPSAISAAVTVTSGVEEEEPPALTEGPPLAARNSMNTALSAGSSGIVLDAIHLPVPDDYTDVSALVAFRKSTGNSRWEQAENQLDLDPEGGTIVVHAPELGVTYTVVDLDDWRTRTRTCEFNSEGSVLLDVDMVLDETPSVQRADPTGERFDAALAMLSNLRGGDDVTVYNLELAEVFISAGWGGSWELSGSRHENAAHLGTPAHGRPIDRARRAIEALSTYDRPLLQSAPDVDPDDEVAGLAYWGFGTRSRLGESTPFGGASFGTPLGSCRNRTVVLITDGELVASEAPYGDHDILSILDPQQPPTHILDVGAGGEGADWLRAVAQRTGGTYTHVPTDTDVPDWNRDLQQPRPSVNPSDFTTDTDADGVPDWVEYNGVRSSTPPAAGSGVERRIFYSSWTDPDTDGDGITDGDELGTPAPRATGSRYPQVTYDVVSDPNNPDSDDDGLDDPDESELVSWPLHQDRDADGLLDGDEIQWGTFPSLPDSDMDGWTDSEEADPSNYGRLDPVNYNEKKSRTWWLHHAELGFFCGDNEVCRRDSIPWLVGNVASGYLIFGDIRDIAWSVTEENYGWAGFTAIMLIPGPGDGAGTAAKVARIWPRLSKAQRTAARYMQWARANENVEATIDLLRRVDLDLHDNLKAYGLADARIAELLAFNDIDHLKRIFDSPQLLRQSPFGSNRPPLVFADRGKSAERWMRNQLGLPADWRTTCRFILFACRFPDGMQPDPYSVGDFIMHESKEGMVTSRALKQIVRDAALVARGENRISGVVWHFFVSGTTREGGTFAGGAGRARAIQYSLSYSHHSVVLRRVVYFDLTREQAWDVVRHIEARAPYRLCLLAELMRDTHGPLDQMDASLDSLVPMWEWFTAIAVAGYPDVPGDVPSTYEPLIVAHAAPGTADLQRRAALLREGLMHYVELVLRRIDPESRWDLWLQKGRVRMDQHQEPVIRLSNGTPIHAIYLVTGMARNAVKDAGSSARDRRALREELASSLPSSWRRDQDRQPSVLVPYLSYAGQTPPAIVTSSPLAVLFDAPTPAPAEPSDDVGVELLLAVGPAAGLDDPRHFAPLPVDTVAAVLAGLVLTHEDGRPVRARELVEDGTQLFAADGTAMIETIATGGALRALSVEPAGGGTAASWARIEDGLRRLAASLGGHLASDSEGWPEP